ncbi:hypothetical protein Hanom_Chr04g00302171 [Helianthus anomalus]
METRNNILLNINVFCFLISCGKKRRLGVFDNGSKRVWVYMGQNSHSYQKRALLAPRRFFLSDPYRIRSYFLGNYNTAHFLGPMRD